MKLVASNITFGHRGLNTFLTVSDTARLSDSIKVYFHKWGLEGIIRNDSKLYDALREFLATYYLPLSKGREIRELRHLGFFEAYSEEKKKKGEKRVYYVIEWSSRLYVIRIRSISLDPSSNADITLEILGSWEEPMRIQVKRMRVKGYTYTWLQVIGEGSLEDVKASAGDILKLVSRKLLELDLDLDSISWVPLWAEVFILYENSLQAEERIKRVLLLAYELWGARSRSRFGDVLIGIGRERGRKAISWVSTPLRVDFLSMFIKSYKRAGWRDGSNSYNKLELRISFRKSRTKERIPYMVALEAGASFLASLVVYSGVKTYEPVQGFNAYGFIEASPRVEVVKSLTVIEIKGDRELYSQIIGKYKAHLDEMALALLEEVAHRGVISSEDLRRFSEEREFIIRGKLTNPSLATVKRRMEKLEKLGLITKWRGGGSKETKNIWYYAFNAGASFKDILEGWKVKHDKKKKIKGDLQKAKAYLISRGYSKVRAEKASLIYVLITNGARSSRAILKLLNKMGIEIKERMVREYLKDLTKLGLVEPREAYRKGKSGKRVRHVFYYAYPLPNGEDKAPYVGSSKPSGEVGSYEG